MMAMRFTGILFIFYFILGGMFIFALDFNLKRKKTDEQIKEEENKEASHLKDVNFYILKSFKPTFYLKASGLDITGNNQSQFIDPIGETISKDGIPVYYQSKFGDVNNETEVFHLKEEVKINYKTMELKSAEANYYKKEERFHAFNTVETSSFSEKTKDKIFIWADEVMSWPNREFARYTGSVRGRLDRAKAYEPGVSFSSNILEADIAQNMIYLTENVFFKKQGLTANSLRAELFLENYNKKLKYYVLYDDVRLDQTLKKEDGTVIIRKGFCSQLDGSMATNEAVMIGSPKVLQGKDVVTGNKITLRENAKLIEVDDNKSRMIIEKNMN